VGPCLLRNFNKYLHLFQTNLRNLCSCLRRSNSLKKRLYWVAEINKRGALELKFLFLKSLKDFKIFKFINVNLFYFFYTFYVYVYLFLIIFFKSLTFFITFISAPCEQIALLSLGVRCSFAKQFMTNNCNE